MSWYLKVAKERDADIVDDLVMHEANVHFEDLGDSYMLIVENAEQHIHVTIPAHRRDKAWVMEQFTPSGDDRG